MIRGLVFDLDGVLIDSEPLHFRATQEILAAHGVPLTDQDYFGRLVALTDVELFGRLLADRPDLVPRAVAEKQARYRVLAQGGLPAFRDGVGLVERSAGRVPLAVATGATREEAEGALRSLGIRDRFVALVTCEDTARGKPDPAPYRLAAARLGLPPEGCLAVEDTVDGIRAARAAGMRCVAVTHTHPREHLMEADLVLQSLDGLDWETALSR